MVGRRIRIDDLSFSSKDYSSFSKEINLSFAAQPSHFFFKNKIISIQNKIPLYRAEVVENCSFVFPKLYN